MSVTPTTMGVREGWGLLSPFSFYNKLMSPVLYRYRCCIYERTDRIVTRRYYIPTVLPNLLLFPSLCPAPCPLAESYPHPFKAKHPTAPYSLHVNQLCLYINPIHCCRALPYFPMLHVRIDEPLERKVSGSDHSRGSCSTQCNYLTNGNVVF